METTTERQDDVSPSLPPNPVAGNGCPYHGAAAGRRSQPPGAPLLTGSPAVQLGESGKVSVNSAAGVRSVLRAGDVAMQDGFGVSDIAKSPVELRPPVLFQDGDEHRSQRTAIAHFFTPKAAKERYRPVMEQLTEELIAELRSAGKADLSTLAMRLAVSVAAQVVGLTNSRKPGMHARLDAFLSLGPAPLSWRPAAVMRFLRLQLGILRFFQADVKPAIAARRLEPRDDVISHLIAQGAADRDILIEAITYGAAGMVTTREFIAISAWHLLDDEELLARYVNGDEKERQALLAEIVRLEPVVGRLFRRLEGDLDVPTSDGPVTLPKGTRVGLDIRSANADEAAVGPHPLCLDPDRRITTRGVQPYGYSFGDGHHRCPGSFLALEEADVFLHRLLSLDGLRLVKPPRVGFNDLVQGYELRDFQVAIA
ncbi:MAG TPA: cytochrome P450 [Trueperaceae bacterium]|nr:cytochrome P450 [Trueperaceae bacterium]